MNLAKPLHLPLNTISTVWGYLEIDGDDGADGADDRSHDNWMGIHGHAKNWQGKFGRTCKHHLKIDEETVCLLSVILMAP